MDNLFAAISTPSYLPTPAEVLEGVRWLRENPAIAAGVVVGLTSYSVAKYYECLEDKPIDINESSEPEHELDNNGETISKEEIARSVSAIQLGLLTMNMRNSSVTESSSGSASSSSSGMRSRASSIFNQAQVVRAFKLNCWWHQVINESLVSMM